MKDGKFLVYEGQPGKDKLIGRFEVKNDEISFPTDGDMLNIDRLPAGPMTKPTEDRLRLFMSGKYLGLRVVRDESGDEEQQVKKFGENNSV